jgi:hypothetical protein
MHPCGIAVVGSCGGLYYIINVDAALPLEISSGTLPKAPDLPTIHVGPIAIGRKPSHRRRTFRNAWENGASARDRNGGCRDCEAVGAPSRDVPVIVIRSIGDVLEQSGTVSFFSTTPCCKSIHLQSWHSFAQSPSAWPRAQPQDSTHSTQPPPSPATPR